MTEVLGRPEGLPYDYYTVVHKVALSPISASSYALLQGRANIEETVREAAGTQWPSMELPEGQLVAHYRDTSNDDSLAVVHSALRRTVRGWGAIEMAPDSPLNLLHFNPRVRGLPFRLYAARPTDSPDEPLYSLRRQSS